MASLPSDAFTAHRHVALWVLRQESNGADGADCSQAAVERSCQKLCTRLARLVTAAGSQALVARAIHLAATDAPFLSGLRAGVVPAACLEGVHEATRGVSPELAQTGLVSVMAHLLGLLVTFIGPDVTARIVGDVWPDPPFGRGEADSTPRELQP